MPQERVVLLSTHIVEDVSELCSRMAVIDQSSFDALLQYVPDFTMHVMNVLADRLKALTGSTEFAQLMRQQGIRDDRQ